ncbi:MAG TPA: hydrogenase 4 subunit B [Patescibacteria group bacterium]|nr:hydrogenase 4 subunit B [Patescibacteria group bacterium]
MIATLFLMIMSLYGIGAFTSLLFRKNKEVATIYGNFFAIAASVLGIILGGEILLTQTVLTGTFPTSLPLFSLTFRLDSLSAYFLLIISTVALASSTYGVGYMRHYFSKYNVGVFGFFYNLFLLSMVLVVTANNAFYFLSVWEIMSLSSLFLVLFEYHNGETLKAGIVYFVMTHVGTACIVAACLLLYGATGSFDFSTIARLSSHIPDAIKAAVFVLALIGFGTKAGIIPLHIWLPKAHSAAPSHVSALMSGVMIKLGIFMMFRFFIEILGQGPFWWGAIILAIGAISSVLGVLYALSEHDIKRLLAYHSIENIGIILLGLGSSMIFLSLHLPALALLAACAGLFHTFNHAIFKSLLFMGAGSVIHATHTRNIEEYGGLIKHMPYTALFFLIGSIAISGLPPFNGFASEWVTFQSLFAGISLLDVAGKTLFLFAAGSLALTGGLAAACFVKAFGITFLARPRSHESEKAKESSLWMIVPLGFLSLLTIIFGLGAGWIIEGLKQILLSVGNFGVAFSSSSTSPMTIVAQNGFAQLNMPIVFLSMVVSILVVYFFTRVISAKQKVARGATWDCGYIGLEGHMEITATAFSRTLIMIFKGLFQPSQQHQVEYIDADIRYLKKSHAVNIATENLYEKYFYTPLQIITEGISRKVKVIQGGNLNEYLLYIFIAIIGLLVWMRYF